MCLAIPARIVEMTGDRAVADAMGNRWAIRTTLTPEVRRQTWELFAQIAEMEAEQNQAKGAEQ